MKMHGKLRLVILACNGAGLLLYLVWLASGAVRVFYTQEGILYFFPFVPFAFVFISLLRVKDAEEPEKKES